MGAKLLAEGLFPVSVGQEVFYHPRAIRLRTVFFSLFGARECSLVDQNWDMYRLQNCFKWVLSFSHSVPLNLSVSLFMPFGLFMALLILHQDLV